MVNKLCLINREDLHTEETQNVIRSVQKTRSGAVLIKMERCGDQTAFKDVANTVIGKSGDAHVLIRRMRFEVLGMYYLTAAIQAAVRKELGNKMSGEIRVFLFAANTGERKMAAVEMDELLVLIKKGKNRIC